jgi:hypothetical protein
MRILCCGEEISSKKALAATSTYPRLIEGNVALQVFSLPTKAPWGLNIDRNRADSDQTWLAFAETWPPKTCNDLPERLCTRLGAFSKWLIVLKANSF